MDAWNIPAMATPGGAVTAEWGRRVVTAVRALRVKGGPNALVSKNGDGATIEPVGRGVKKFEYNAVRPFSVRWFQTGEDEEEGEWQIYLPSGCVMLDILATGEGGTSEDGPESKPYIAKNDDPTEPDDGFAPLYGWYKIADPEDADAAVETRDGYAAKVWTVRLAVFPWPRLEATTERSESYGPVWKSVPVASIAVVEVAASQMHDAYKMRRVTRLIAEDSLEFEWDETQPFSIHFTLSSETAKNATVASAKVVNQVVAVGRLMLTPAGNAATAGTGVKTCGEGWARVNHAQPEFSLEVVDTLTGDDAKSDDDKTVWRIYTMSGDVAGLPVADSRSTMPVMDFYTNAPEENPSGESGGASES